MTRWSVSLEADADRVMTVEEVVELADAVATSGGIASGIGSTRYGAQVIVDADGHDEALAKGRAVFAAAVETAGLPSCPVVRADAVSEDDDRDADE